MEIVARAMSVRISPRKVRLVADSIRNLSLQAALDNLSLVHKRGASDLYKTLKSAISNAVHNAKKKEEDLVIKRIEVSEGASLKRMHASTRGRAHPYKKRGSHIKIILTEKGEGLKG